ncbi:hypothetical protein D3C85_1819520 [compost metagenome]
MTLQPGIQFVCSSKIGCIQTSELLIFKRNDILQRYPVLGRNADAKCIVLLDHHINGAHQGIQIHVSFEFYSP